MRIDNYIAREIINLRKEVKEHRESSQMHAQLAEDGRAKLKGLEVEKQALEKQLEVVKTAEERKAKLEAARLKIQQTKQARNI